MRALKFIKGYVSFKLHYIYQIYQLKTTLDGEKLICMDGLYEDVITNNCLVYSFGVGKYNLKVQVSLKNIGIISMAPKMCCVLF